MSLSDEAYERLEDIVELQPTKNGTLQDRWDMDSGSDVHSYLESELQEYYYRNENSLICATPAGEMLVGNGEEGGNQTVTGTVLDRQVIDALPGPEQEPQSVVATLHAIEGTNGEASVDDVRSSLHGLVDRGLVERIRRTVPTFRLAIERERITIEVDDE